MESFGKFMAGLFLVAIDIIVKGFVFCKFWLWFIIPVFKVQPLLFIHAIGLIFIISYIKGTKINDDESSGFNWGKFIKTALTSILTALVMLFIDWLVHLFY